jgi:hypothetical protein
VALSSRQAVSTQLGLMDVKHVTQCDAQGGKQAAAFRSAPGTQRSRQVATTRVLVQVQHLQQVAPKVTQHMAPSETQ